MPCSIGEQFCLAPVYGPLFFKFDNTDLASAAMRCLSQRIACPACEFLHSNSSYSLHWTRNMVVPFTTAAAEWELLDIGNGLPMLPPSKSVWPVYLPHCGGWDPNHSSKAVVATDTEVQQMIQSRTVCRHGSTTICSRWIVSFLCLVVLFCCPGDETHVWLETVQGKQPGSVWQWEELLDLISKLAAVCFAIQQCHFGGSPQSPVNDPRCHVSLPQFDKQGYCKGPLPKDCGHVHSHKLIGKIAFVGILLQAPLWWSW